MLFKYEVSLQNKLNQITNLKMDLDDRDIAVDLFFRKKLKATDLKNLTKSEIDILRATHIQYLKSIVNLLSAIQLNADD